MKKRFFRRKRRRKNRKQEGLVKKLGTLNLILALVFAYMIFFNEQMVVLYLIKGSAPESAWCALIAALIGECGICGWIKTSKEKHRSDGDGIEEPQETGPPKDPVGDPEEAGNEIEETEDEEG